MDKLKQLLHLTGMKKLLIALSIVLTVFGCTTKQGSEKLPNIILIVADDLGYNDLSCYRAANNNQSELASTSETPHIDKLAKDGIRFTNFYSGAAVCSPSRAALLTGRNKTRLGIYNWIPADTPMHLKSAETTIAEMLKEKNYATAHFGKWHLTSENMPQPEPLDQGYDYAFWTHNNAIPSHKNPNNFIRNREETGILEGYSCQLVVSEARKWLDSQQNTDTPFYINLWFHEPHSKEAAPDSLKAKHQRNKAYYGCIENMDYAVGHLVEYLQETGMDENTIIIFTSDNGSRYLGSNEPLRGEKCFQYEGGIRVPFIVSWKEKINANRESDIVGHFTDVLPTLAAITHSQIPQKEIIDGENLADFLQGTNESYTRNEALFFYRYFHDPICMLRQGDFVLLGYQNEPKAWQLDYDGGAEALFKPTDDEPRWSQWRFQESHMKALKLQEPKYFELYNVKTDVAQRIDLSTKKPEQTEHMKQTMLQKRKEMLAEGGDWYSNK